MLFVPNDFKFLEYFTDIILIISLMRKFSRLALIDSILKFSKEKVEGGKDGDEIQHKRL